MIKGAAFILIFALIWFLYPVGDMGLWDGLIFRAKLDEASGTRVDDIGGRNLTELALPYGRLVAKQKWGLAVPAGYVSGDILDWTDLGNPLVCGDNWTIALWIKHGAESPGVNKNTFVITLGDDENNYPTLEYGYNRYTSSDGIISIWEDYDKIVPFLANDWHCLIAWKDGADIFFSVDDGSPVALNSPPDTWPAWTGNLVSIEIWVDIHGTSQVISFGADLFCIWGRTLSSSERTAFYNYREAIPSGGPSGDMLLVLGALIAGRK